MIIPNKGANMISGTVSYVARSLAWGEEEEKPVSVYREREKDPRKSASINFNEFAHKQGDYINTSV
jgi:hypothetical protein